MSEVVFIDNSMNVREAISDAALAFLIEASGEIQSETIRNTPVDTGQLKGSWKYNINESCSQVGKHIKGEDNGKN